MAGSPSRPAAAHLLVVRLDGAGWSQVDHRADVGPVDAHAEGVGRDHDLGSAFGEVGLRVLAGPSVEAGVIGPRTPPAAGEALRLLFRLLARGGVDDGRSTRPVRTSERLGEGGVDEALPLARARHLHGAEGQVGAREAADDLGRVGGQAEPRQDLVAHDRGRRRRAGQHARGPQLGEEPPDAEVLRPKVMPPLADAMRLVDGDQRALEVAQEPAEAVEGQALRRRVDEVEAPRRHLRHAAAHLAGVEGGREERRRHAPGLERLHLIGHERDERRDDEGRAGQHRGGELIDQALAAARGRDQQEPPALEQGLDRLALPGPKARVPEPGERRVEARRSRRGFSD